jgi:hypothetical protein
VQLKDLLRRVSRKPFKPIRLFLTDGGHHDVRHPELIMVGKRSLMVGLTGDPEQKFYDDVVDIDILLRVEPLDIGTTKNGQ